MNPYQYTYPSVQRLYNDYLKHKNLIIAADFDSTIFDFKKEGHTYEEIIELLKMAKQQGHYVIIYTARNSDTFDFVKDYVRSIGLEIDGINAHPFPLDCGNSGKLFYNILLDDKAGLGQAMSTLRFTLEKIKSLSNDIQ